MIIRTKRNGRYTTVSNSVIDNLDISYEVLGLWLYLMSKPDNWQVRMKDLQSRLSARQKGDERQTYGRDAMQRMLKDMKAAGLASIEYVQDESGIMSGREWVVYDEIKPKKPTTGKPGHRAPTTGKPDCRKTRPSENPTVGKPGHIVNTELLVNTNNTVNTEVVEETETLLPPPPQKNYFPDQAKVEAITQVLIDQSSYMVQQSTATLKEKNRTLETEAREFAKAVFHKEKFPLTKFSADELRKRFYQSCKAGYAKPVEVQEKNEHGYSYFDLVKNGK